MGSCRFPWLAAWRCDASLQVTMCVPSINGVRLSSLRRQQSPGSPRSGGQRKPGCRVRVHLSPSECTSTMRAEDFATFHRSNASHFSFQLFFSGVSMFFFPFGLFLNPCEGLVFNLYAVFLVRVCVCVFWAGYRSVASCLCEPPFVEIIFCFHEHRCRLSLFFSILMCQRSLCQLSHPE